MKNEDKKSLIKKEQLRTKQSFIGHCSFDDASAYATRKINIDEKFLYAAEGDGFIRPLLQVDEKIKQPDGSEVTKRIAYYSPFQIYIIAQLRENSVLEDGLLWGDIVRGSVEFYRQQGSRTMNWGQGMGFNVGMRKNKKKPPSPIFNPFLVCDDYHRFLELLHSLDLYPRHQLEYGEGRMFGNAPSYAYNFDPIKMDGKNLLKKYGLSLDKINALRAHVGSAATMIDPLERWYYYIVRHSQSKRDLLKGDAAIAQELYAIYDFLTKIHEVVSGLKPQPLLEFLHQKHFPYLMARSELQRGEDLKALQFAIQQFKPWTSEKKNKPFATPEITSEIATIEKKLADYELRYGDRSYPGSLRYTASEGKTLDDLDDEDKKYVLDQIKQMKDQGIDADLDREIGYVIMHRLGDLKHELSTAFWKVSKQFQDRENEAWNLEQRFASTFWPQNHEKLLKLNRDQQMALQKTEHDKIIKNAQKWETRRGEFNEKVAGYVGLAFCSVCRKNPIQLHIENNNRNTMEISHSVVCDECIKNAREPRELTGGEWDCRYCGEKLHQFVSQNVVNDLLLNRASARIDLEYGRMTITTRCRKCKKENIRPIEWGWMP